MRKLTSHLSGFAKPAAAVILFATSLSLGPAMVFAQGAEEAGLLEEVIVTAQKREQAMQEQFFNGVFQVTSNAAAATIRGFEMDLTALPASWYS